MSATPCEFKNGSRRGYRARAVNRRRTPLSAKGEKILAAIEQAGLSQAGFAERMGLSPDSGPSVELVTPG